MQTLPKSPQCCLLPSSNCKASTIHSGGFAVPRFALRLLPSNLRTARTVPMPRCEDRVWAQAHAGKSCCRALGSEAARTFCSRGLLDNAQVSCPSSPCSTQTLVNRYSVRLSCSWAFLEQVHAGYVMFWALLSPCYYWSEMGGMFHGPAQSVEKAKGLKTKADPSVLCRVEDWLATYLRSFVVVGSGYVEILHNFLLASR